MRSLAQLIDDALDLAAGPRFDRELVGRDVIDLGAHAERVRAIADQLNAHRKGRPKQALVLWTTGFSAITKRGPWVYIARSLVDKLSDDGVAFVLAHEMAHHDLRHLSPTLMVAGFLGETQRMEFHADRHGMQLAQRAGFSADGAFEALSPALWEEQAPEPETWGTPQIRAWVNRFRKSHPPLAARLEALRSA